MKITKKRAIHLFLGTFFILSQLVIFFPAFDASAGSLWESQEGRNEMATAFGETSPDQPSDVRVIVANVIKIFLGFMGVLFMVLNIMAGIKWMTAGGNEQAVTESKSQLARASIGLAIILMAYSITYFVTERLVQGTTGSIW